MCLPFAVLFFELSPPPLAPPLILWSRKFSPCDIRRSSARLLIEKALRTSSKRDADRALPPIARVCAGGRRGGGRRDAAGCVNDGGRRVASFSSAACLVLDMRRIADSDSGVPLLLVHGRRSVRAMSMYIALPSFSSSSGRLRSMLPDLDERRKCLLLLLTTTTTTSMMPIGRQGRGGRSLLLLPLLLLPWPEKKLLPPLLLP